MDGMEFPNLNLLGDSFAQVSHRSRGFKRERDSQRLIGGTSGMHRSGGREGMTIQLRKEANVKHLQD